MRYIPLAALLLLSACGSSGDAKKAGGVTAGEAKALDEAAEMLEAKRLPPDAIPSAAPVPPAKN